MKLNKSYSLLKYLNREHSTLERYTLAGLGWLGTAICTRSTTLSAGISRDFASDRFDLAFRKASRFARLFWSKLELFHIPFFDFTQNTTPAERRIMIKQIKKNTLASLSTEQLSDLLYLLAEDIHSQIALNKPVQPLVNEFYQAANLILKRIPDIKERPRINSKVPTGKFKKQDAILALHDLVAILPLEDWPWYIMSGTFLGQHREGGFLSHDYDIDIGINAEDISVSKLIERLQQQTTFTVQVIDKSIDIVKNEDEQRSLDVKTSLLKIIHKNGIPIDVFIHYTENGECWHGSVIHRWSNTPFSLSRTTMEGVIVNCPEDADLYLTENYGNWQTPVTEFDCTTGTPNLTISRNFKSLALLIRRLAYFSAHDRKQAKKLQGTLVQTNVLKNVKCESGKVRLSLALQL